MKDESLIIPKLDIFNKIKNLKSIDEIFDVIYAFWLNFEQPRYKGIEDFINEHYLENNLFEELAKNELFISSIKKVIDRYHLSHEEFTYNIIYPCLEDCTIINSFVLLLGFPLSYYFDKLSKGQVLILRGKISDLLKEIERKIDYKGSYYEISTILNYSTQNLAYCHHPKNFPKHYGLNWETLISKLKETRIFMAAVYIMIPQIYYISSTLSEYSKFKAKSKFVSLSKILSSLFKATAKVDHAINHLEREYFKLYSDTTKFLEFIENFKTVNEKIIDISIIQMTQGVIGKEESEHDNFSEMIIKKIKGIDLLIDKVKESSLKLLSAYSSKDHNKGEWSNKVFISTIKTLSALAIVNKSKNDLWKMGVIVREYHHWLDNIHEIINRNILVDDWKIIKDFVLEEMPNLEWKSSFFTPIQGDDLIYSEKLFLMIIKNIIGMMNSVGGHILVGMVEKPEEVKNEEVKKHLFTKNGKTFFDINYELQNSNSITTHDELKRRIQDKLNQLTGRETSYFDSYWNINDLVLKNDDKNFVVYLINVKKCDILTLCIEDKEKKSFSLVKRLNGKTENIDIKNYIKLVNTSI